MIAIHIAKTGKRFVRFLLKKYSKKKIKSKQYNYPQNAAQKNSVEIQNEMRTKRCKRELFSCAFASVTLTILADLSKVNMALFKITFSVISFWGGGMFLKKLME